MGKTRKNERPSLDVRLRSKKARNRFQVIKVERLSRPDSLEVNKLTFTVKPVTLKARPTTTGVRTLCIDTASADVTAVSKRSTFVNICKRTTLVFLVIIYNLFIIVIDPRKENTVDKSNF